MYAKWLSATAVCIMIFMKNSNGVMHGWTLYMCKLMKYCNSIKLCRNWSVFVCFVFVFKAKLFFKKINSTRLEKKRYLADFFLCPLKQWKLTNIPCERQCPLIEQDRSREIPWHRIIIQVVELLKLLDNVVQLKGIVYSKYFRQIWWKYPTICKCCHPSNDSVQVAPYS